MIGKDEHWRVDFFALFTFFFAFSTFFFFLFTINYLHLYFLHFLYFRGRPQEGHVNAADASMEEDSASVRARKHSAGKKSSGEDASMDLTLIGEEINLETPNGNATLFLQLFDDDDDVDDLIG